MPEGGLFNKLSENNLLSPFFINKIKNSIQLNQEVFLCRNYSIYLFLYF